ncbi:FtsL-like putative cell division protein [Hymenobacter latericus]|uniref:FtsL-like putative cell division protein n=1 Tax=Hymenobacter sp. YIM 151858-1 TaxID=2987688 RepID=UPI002226232A|nr:FtsL-like putative cell division protein [Hymenobacter sp. YIM 151858-1]UYZ60908.1 FtsL-like putative cell division protein [Hymenobacter sp. YIM 151858-1]
MAVNTLRPTTHQPRQNVPREVAPPAPEPEQLPEPEPVPEPRRPRPEPETKPRRQSTWSIFSVVEKVVNVDGLFRDGVPVRFLPHTLFVMFLILLYIGNTHYATRMNRSIQKLKVETEDLRADYTTLKSDYMEASKQSEVARKVAAYGLVESSSPPFRITVPAGGLDEAELDRLPVITADSLAARAVRDSAAVDSATQPAAAPTPEEEQH